MLEEICQVPVLGVVPMFEDIAIEEEDSVGLERKRRTTREGEINIAVIRLRHISNFTDFDTLERDERVNLYYTDDKFEITKADMIVIPGTKSTLSDLSDIKESGVAETIVREHQKGKLTIGICGGFQMLGTSVNDPDGIEGSRAEMSGLGLIDMTTTMSATKKTQQVEFEFGGKICHGYEIHHGVSQRSGGTRLPNVIDENNCFGTYIHGALDNAAVIEHLLAKVRRDGGARLQIDHEEFKQQQYDKLAAHVRRHVDIAKIYEILNHD